MSIPPFIPATEIRKSSIKLGKESIVIVTAPGFPGWETLFPSAQLLAEYSWVNPTDSALLIGTYPGALGVHLARKLPQGQLSIMDNNWTALEITQRTLSANNIPPEVVNILPEIDLPQDLYQKSDVVLIQIPKGRFLTRRWLVQAYNSLAIGGSLYIAGSNNSGIQSAVKDAQGLFGPGRILAYKKGNRVAEFVKKLADTPQPGWAQAPGIASCTWVEFTIPFSNHTFHIRSLPGIFSFDHLDEGTDMLLRTIDIPAGARVLDVGCGYGIIGLFAATQGAGSVHLTDNSLLAVAACTETIARNRITNAEVFTGDLLGSIGSYQYDLILSNPPFHAGHAVDYQIAHSMINQSFQALNSGGQMIIVANRFIRYDRLIKEIFGNISILAESGKFHVLSGLKSS